jgi:cysteine-rich repeat protein
MRRRSTTVLAGLIALFAPSMAAAFDLTGRWQMDFGTGPERVDVVQTGSSVAFTISGFPIVATLNGNDLVYQPDPLSGFGARVFQDGNEFLGSAGAVSNPYAAVISGVRCQCDDGNSTAGDGCDARCQLEPCFDCTGMPSTCAPSPDGAACDDGHVCTSGETCTGGVCGDGSPVASPCVDLDGRWLFHFVQTPPDQFFPPPSDSLVLLHQRNARLTYGNFVGDIDPATGAFDLISPNTYVFCSWDTFIGSGSADGSMLVATQSIGFQFGGIGNCYRLPWAVTGERSTCGNGTLDDGEACDDGNFTSGDGCDENCRPTGCGNGIVTGSEECDDGNTIPLDGCGATCLVERCGDGVLQPGEACDDGNNIGGDGCEPDCQLPPPGCGNWVVDVGEGCDDGNLVDGDGCSGTCAIETCWTCGGSPSICAPGIRPMCRHALDPVRSRLRIRNATDASRDSIVLKVERTDAAPLGMLGDPVSTDDYALCVFGPTGTVIFSATAPHGGVCRGRPCWKAQKSGFAYADRDASRDGIAKLKLKSGDTWKPTAVVVGKGPSLSGRPAPLPGVPLALPVRAQIQGPGGLCFEATFTTATRNDAASGRFSANGAP